MRLAGRREEVEEERKRQLRAVELEELEERPLVAALPPWPVESRQEHGLEGKQLPSGPPWLVEPRRKHGLEGELLPSGPVVP